MKGALYIVILFSFLFSIVSVVRHNHFFSQGHDLAIFTQSAWLYSYNLPPLNTVTGKLDYQDRYKPVMLLLGQLYRLWRNPIALLILQGTALSFSGLFIYYLARHLLLTHYESLIILLHYLLFPGITSFIIDDFHEVSLFPLFFAGSLYFYLKRNKPLFSLFLIISLLIREYLTIFTLIFWLCVYLSRQKLFKNKLANLSLILSFCFTVGMFVVIKVSGGIAYQSFIYENDSLIQALIYLISHPLDTVISFFYPWTKLTSLSILSTYFLFLPLTQVWLLPVIIFQLAGRFYDFQHSYRWSVLYHYSAEIAVILTLGTILTLAHYSSKKRKFLLGALLIMMLIYAKTLHSPLLLLTKKAFLNSEPWMDDIAAVLKQIPPVASVSSQNNLAPHLANRQHIYILPQLNNAEYVVMDLRPNQDQFNFYNQTLDEMNNLRISLENNYQYKLQHKRGEVYLYRKALNTNNL